MFKCEDKLLGKHESRLWTMRSGMLTSACVMQIEGSKFEDQPNSCILHRQESANQVCRKTNQYTISVVKSGYHQSDHQWLERPKTMVGKVHYNYIDMDDSSLTHTAMIANEKKLTQRFL